MSVFSYPFFDRYHFRNGVSEVVFSKLRPSVQEPTAMVSFQEGTFHHCDFLPYNQSILFRKKGFIQKSVTSCQNISFFEKVLLPNFMVQFNLHFFSDFPTPSICMAEGVSVLSYPFFLDIDCKRGFWEIVFRKRSRKIRKKV